MQDLSTNMSKNLKDLGFKDLTPIQSKAIPVIIEGKDIIAKAKTGSGKSAAFGVGIVERLDIKRHGVQALILSPTRELAQQLVNELRRVARAKANTKILLLSGGHSLGYQLGSLRHEAHIIVGTPGRVLKHLKKGSLKLEKLDILVFDEADRLLDLGFLDDIREIVTYTNSKRNTLLFSATFSDEIREISKEFQNSPVEIEVSEKEDKPLIFHFFYRCDFGTKFDTILSILHEFKPESTIIFVNQKIVADELSSKLSSAGVDSKAIHGDLEQIDRTDTLMAFSNSSISVLVATDVAARGLDIKDVKLVINYDLPNSKETYIHRIGRVGRAGKEGIATTLITKDSYILDEIEEYLGHLEYKNSKEIKSNFKLKSKYKTLCILGGRKDKLRAGDIVGALTKKGGFNGEDIGNIDIQDRDSYIAIKEEIVDEVYNFLISNRVKNIKFRVEKL